MKFLLIALLFFLLNTSNYAREYRDIRDNSSEEDETTTIAPIISSPRDYDDEEVTELSNKTAESAAVLISKITQQIIESRNQNNVADSKMGFGKAFACSQLDCPASDKIGPVCACNFNTGNVASFKNTCDSLKHNCRFDTDFKVILEDICPWEFSFRRGKEYEFDYRDAKYYN